MNKKHLVVGMSGASGAPLCIGLLKALREHNDWQSHLIVSDSALITLQHEMSMTESDIQSLADHYYHQNDIGARIASGTFKTEGMVVIPCSMKTLAGIRSGYSDNLLLRAADVTLKERRRLVLVARETPLSTIHLENMLTLSKTGVTIMPAMLSYYQKPESVEDITNHLIGKVMDSLGIEMNNFRRWDGI